MVHLSASSADGVTSEALGTRKGGKACLVWKVFCCLRTGAGPTAAQAEKSRQEKVRDAPLGVVLHSARVFQIGCPAKISGKLCRWYAWRAEVSKNSVIVIRVSKQKNEEISAQAYPLRSFKLKSFITVVSSRLSGCSPEGSSVRHLRSFRRRAPHSHLPSGASSWSACRTTGSSRTAVR